MMTEYVCVKCGSRVCGYAHLLNHTCPDCRGKELEQERMEGHQKWLADEASDALSVEWMESVGFVRGCCGWRLGEWPNALELEYWDNTAKGEVFRLPTNGYMPSRVLIDGKAKLRALCEVMGVKLKEVPG